MTWRPLPILIVYALLLGLAIRFLHYALFDETLLSLHYYLIDAGVAFIAALTGWYLRRAAQMVRQYSWLYESNGPFAWRQKSAAK